MNKDKKVAQLIDYWSKHRCVRCQKHALNPTMAKKELKLREFCNTYICEKCYNDLFVGGTKS